jgi:hypothetical protein|nr:MAG TPA: hypothetical protein [Caudoviricetes sp.]
MKSLLRDNKSILNYLINKVYPYQRDVIVSVRVKYCVGNETISTIDYRIGIKATEDMYSWVESGKNLLYCLDTSKLEYYNVKSYGLSHTDKYNSDVFSDDLFDDVYNNVLKSLNRKHVSSDSSGNNVDILHRLLDSYNINMMYGSVQEFIGDSTTNQILKHCMREHIIGDIVSSILQTLQNVEFISSINDMLVDTSKLPLLRYDAISQYVYIPYYSCIYTVRLMSYKGSGKDYRNIVSVSDIVNNTIPTNVKHWFNKDMRLILSSKCVCNIDIEGNY